MIIADDSELEEALAMAMVWALFEGRLRPSSPKALWASLSKDARALYIEDAAQFLAAYRGK